LYIPKGIMVVLPGIASMLVGFVLAEKWITQVLISITSFLKITDFTFSSVAVEAKTDEWWKEYHYCR